MKNFYSLCSTLKILGGNKTFKKADGAEMEWGAEEDRGFSCSSTGLSFTDDTSVQFKNLKVVAFAASKHDSFTDAGKTSAQPRFWRFEKFRI